MSDAPLPPQTAIKPTRPPSSERGPERDTRPINTTKTSLSVKPKPKE